MKPTYLYKFKHKDSLIKDSLSYLKWFMNVKIWKLLVGHL